MPPKKNEPTRYTLNMSEQDNKENIIRMTEQIKAIDQKIDSLEKATNQRLDGLLAVVNQGFADIKTESRDMEARYATKEEVHELKKSHQSLVKYLMVIVITIVSVIIVGVMALIGFK